MENNYIQNTGLNRNILDKYYTKQSIAEECINKIKENVPINKTDLIIEPSAGNGSFIKYIKTLSNNYKFFDLEPNNNEVIKQDFLKYNYDNILKTFNNIHIIGNPPFGRQSSLAIKFIKICCNFANSISFILPRSFKKESMKRHFSNYFYLIYENDLPQYSFLVNETEKDVPCVFQIWERRTEKRKGPLILKPKNFKFVKKEDNPDISFRRVGVYAGAISKEISNKSIQSHYFIKLINNKFIDDFYNNLQQITFETNNTVGPKSISKQEVIIEYNKILKNNKK